MATISFVKPALPIIDPSKQTAQLPQAEELETNVTWQLQGALTVAIVAPSDDQLLFKLVSPEDREKNMLSKVWVQATLRALQATVHQMVEQALVQSRLYPIASIVQPAFAIDPQGNLIYLFQVPVQTFPPQPEQLQAAAPAPANDTAPAVA